MNTGEFMKNSFLNSKLFDTLDKVTQSSVLKCFDAVQLSDDSIKRRAEKISAHILKSTIDELKEALAWSIVDMGANERSEASAYKTHSVQWRS